MPFFVPSRLIELEYLVGGETDEEYTKMARDYQNEIDLAFFVTNFNYSKSDYYELTPLETAFIVKAWETKLVNDTTQIRNSVSNAINNSMRKKGSRPVDLWNKKPQKLDKEVAQNNLKVVEDLEKDKGWVDEVYKLNGMKKPKGGS